MPLEEMQQDRAYLARVRALLESHGLEVDAMLRMGDPAKELCRVAEEEAVDLIAMATHGHHGIGRLAEEERRFATAGAHFASMFGIVAADAENAPYRKAAIAADDGKQGPGEGKDGEHGVLRPFECATRG